MLEGLTIVVSGVGSGLGREVATVALRDGANVVLGSRREEHLAEIAAALDPSGERVAHARTDITDPAQCEALAALGVERFGGVDGLAQVAAFDPPFGGGPGIYVVNVDGSGVPVKLTSGLDDTQPRFSPDGKKIMFLRGAPFTMNAKATGPSLVSST